MSAPATPETWTVLSLIRWSAEYLAGKGVEQARLDAEHLLADALGTSRLELYLQFDRPLDAGELARFKPLLLRRAGREPLQYVLGHTAFRELELRTDPRALVPRPETEVLVEVVLEWARERAPDGGLSALDVGTGTGCIALSLAVEGPFGRVVATDVSPEALEVAAANVAAAGMDGRVELRAGDLWGPLEAGERFDAVVSNPPYVADGERDALEPEVREWEPEGALFAGPEGTEVLRELVAGAEERLNPGGLLAVEVGLGQAEAVAGLLRERSAYDPVRVRRDLAGRPRIVTAQRRGAAGG